MSSRNRRSGFLGYTLGPSSYSYYPSYYSSGFYQPTPSTSYSSYTPSYSRFNSDYSTYESSRSRKLWETPREPLGVPRETPRDPPVLRTQRTRPDYDLGLRRKSVEIPTMAKEASVTRELIMENRDATSSRYRRNDFTPSREETQPIPPPRSKRWESSYSSSSSSYLPDWVSNASSRFSKATASLYQKSRGALGILRSSSMYDLRGSTSDLRGSTSNLMGSTTDLRRSTTDLRGSTSNLMGSSSDLRRSNTDLRGSNSDLRGSTSNPGDSNQDTRGTLYKTRGSLSNLRELSSDLRSSRTDLSGSTIAPHKNRDRTRRQTTQVSDLDLSRAQSWRGSSREPRDRSSRELSADTSIVSKDTSRDTLLVSVSGILSRSKSSTDLGYSSHGSSRRPSTSATEEIERDYDNIDYKKLWEESQAENARLRLEMAAIREELEITRRKLEETLLAEAKMRESENNGAMEQKLMMMEADIQELRKLREENEELSTQNSSLSQAISKMSAAFKTTRV